MDSEYDSVLPPPGQLRRHPLINFTIQSRHGSVLGYNAKTLPPTGAPLLGIIDGVDFTAVLGQESSTDNSQATLPSLQREQRESSTSSDSNNVPSLVSATTASGSSSSIRVMSEVTSRDPSGSKNVPSLASAASASGSSSSIRVMSEVTSRDPSGSKNVPNLASAASASGSSSSVRALANQLYQLQVQLREEVGEVRQKHQQLQQKVDKLEERVARLEKENRKLRDEIDKKSEEFKRALHNRSPSVNACVGFPKQRLGTKAKKDEEEEGKKTKNAHEDFPSSRRRTKTENATQFLSYLNAKNNFLAIMSVSG
jgi:hypothetical protein